MERAGLSWYKSGDQQCEDYQFPAKQIPGALGIMAVLIWGFDNTCQGDGEKSHPLP